MRKNWNDHFMDIAKLVSTRSTCIRRQVGAVLVKDRQVLATGYNGAPTGIKHCGDRGCLRQLLNVPSGEKHELCRGVHAEQNVICQAAKHGVSINNSCLYVTHFPCSICLKMLINVGVKIIYVKEAYPDRLAEELYDECDNITIIKLKED